MIFDFYAFLQSLLGVIPLILVVSLLLIALTGMAMKNLQGARLVIVVNYITCIGIVMHEVAHELFCKIFGVKVKSAQYFYVDEKFTDDNYSLRIGGRLNLGDCHSTMAGLFLTTAPFFFNGLLIALLFYYAPQLEGSMWFLPAVWFGISLLFHAKPSTPDMRFLAASFAKKPVRGFLELLLFCMLIGVLVWVYSTFQPELWVLLTSVFILLIILVLVGRWKISTQSSQYIPRT